MKRFELTRVKVTYDETGDYPAGEIFCAIKDNSEFTPEWIELGQFQPYCIIHHPIDAKEVADLIQEANITNDPIHIMDDKYFDWVIKGITDCEEV